MQKAWNLFGTVTCKTTCLEHSFVYQSVYLSFFHSFSLPFFLYANFVGCLSFRSDHLSVYPSFSQSVVPQFALAFFAYSSVLGHELKCHTHIPLDSNCIFFCNQVFFFKYNSPCSEIKSKQCLDIFDSFLHFLENDLEHESI